MKQFASLRIRTYSYSPDNSDGDKKNQKAQKKCVIKTKFKFELFRSNST